MKRHLLLMVAMCATFIMYAQTSNTLSGVIVDEKGNAVESAVVSWLTLPDSTLVVNGISDATGHFSLVAPKTVSGSSVAVVSCIGYAHTAVTVEPERSSGLHFVLKEISHQLQGVTVTAKSTMKGVPGGYSFTPGGADLLLPDGNELLKNVPMLSGTVGSYKLLGKQKAKIYLNGRDPYMDASMLYDLLANVKPSDIERVELIFNPGSSRSASDNSGIVNIVLKRRPDFGFTGSAYLQASDQNKHVSTKGDITLSYSHGRFRAMGSLTGSADNRYSKYELKYNYLDTHVDATNVSFSKGKKYKPHFGALVSYDLSPKSTIGIKVMEDLTISRSSDFTHTLSTDAANVNSEISTNRTYRTPSGIKSDVTLYYYLMTDKRGGGLDVSLNYINNNAPTRDTMTYVGAEQAASACIPFVQNIESSINAWQAEAKYKHNFSDGSNLSFGARWNFSRTDQDFLHADMKNGVFVRDDGQSNRFVYDEMVSAVFVNYDRQWNEMLSSTLGLRGEQTHIRGDQRATNEVFRNNYFNLMPNIGLNFSFAQGKHIFGLDYAPSLMRAPYVLLNPFKIWTSSNSYQVGNPDLKADYMHYGAFRYTLFGKYTLSVKGMWQPNSFADFTTSDGQNNTVSSYIMYGRTQVYDIILSGYQSLLKGRLRVFVDIDANYRDFNSNVQGVLSSKHGWRLITTETVYGYFEKDYTSGISILHSWEGRHLEPQRVDAANHYLSVSLWKKFKWDGQLEISYSSILPSTMMQSYEMPNYRYSSRSLGSEAKVRITYYQRFGKKKVKEAKGHSGNSFSGRM